MLEFYGRASAVLMLETEKLQSSTPPAKRERTA
jgi:hypothetical protein